MSRLIGVLLWTLPVAAQTGVNLTVAAVQLRSTFKVEENRQKIIEALNRVADRGANVAVFPECALTGYHSRHVGATSEEIAAAEEEIRQTCKHRGIAAVVGSIFRINGRTFITAVVFDSRGELVERYGKLVLAGEEWAVPGNHIAFFELEGIPSTVIICRDKRAPEIARLPAMAGARILYYIGHESGVLYESRLKPLRAQMMARAAENTMFVVAANSPGDVNDASNSHGQGRIIRPDGNVLREASIFGEDILIETLSIEPRKLDGPQQGLMGDWWRQGVEFLMKNRHRKLE